MIFINHIKSFVSENIIFKKYSFINTDLNTWGRMQTYRRNTHITSILHNTFSMTYRDSVWNRCALYKAIWRLKQQSNLPYCTFWMLTIGCDNKHEIREKGLFFPHELLIQTLKNRHRLGSDTHYQFGHRVSEPLLSANDSWVQVFHYLRILVKP